jgi:hypothetical protein
VLFVGQVWGRRLLAQLRDAGRDGRESA